VKRDRLDEVPRLRAAALDRRADARPRELQRRDALRHELLGLGEVDELAQPLDEQQRPVGRLDLDLACRRGAIGVAGELGERGERLLEGGPPAET
jgi:hypothetical protein